MHVRRSQISQLFRPSKMKVAIVLLAVLACGLALPKYQGPQVHHDDVKQQHVFDILKYINNPMYHKEFLQIAQNFNLESNAHHYKQEVFEHFLELHNHDVLLKKGEIFSILNEDHMQQAKALFKLFFYADSYEVFHHTAVWARHHLNEGLFLYSYSVAIVHRPDTQGLVLPPVYELFPHHFFNSEVIHKAYRLKMAHQDHGKQQEHYTIHANYSGSYLNLDPEQSLSYYLEDVGLNAFYFYYHIYFPYWMNSDEFHLSYNRGELFYHVHKQLYARYHLERLSHGLGDIEYFNWDLPFKTGYYPSLTYANGLPFPERPHFANLREYLHYYGQRLCDRNEQTFDYTNVQTYEQRIREAIDSGFVHDHEGNKHQLYTAEGINILGNIIEGNADSPNYHYYGSFVNTARHLLGYSKHPLNHHKLAPSVLEHYSTSLRDPAFYHIYKKVFLLIDQYKQNLPHYHQKHLYQSGLKIEDVEFDKLVTYYDHFWSDITNGLFVTPEEFEEDSFRVKVHQYRLNHKNFNYKVHVKSDKALKAAVRVFIGPKFDEHGRPLKLSQIHDKVFQIDYFTQDLKVGDNMITRNSADFNWFIKDLPSFFDGKHSDVSEIQHGLPLRFKLPRGSEEGTSFQVYVIVYPHLANKNDPHQEADGLHLKNFVPDDSFALGYPFDRPTEYEDVYHVPNAYVKHVKIYHQVNQDILHGISHDSSLEHDDDDDVHVYQFGDHNNYKKLHYQVENNDDQHTDKLLEKILHEDELHNKMYARPTSVKSMFPVLTTKYSWPQVYAPQYKNYQQVKTGKYEVDQLHGNVDNQIQYKKQNVYYEDQVNDKYHKQGLNDQVDGKYQNHYGVDDNLYSGKYQNHGFYVADQGFSKYGKSGVYGGKYSYGNVYGTKVIPYQNEYQVKYGYGDDYQTSSEEHHDPLYHHY
ncbi:arylphorin subunit alpha-like [Harmonia axyridis]|uniref:arylphorin subunit alpha-like n=1 Tax=Harmonia axyridis TaxID=115357 RepID=UPI001E27674E|nr:arylphorin subunit alpha-like [Harmonia axyridis]